MVAIIRAGLKVVPIIWVELLKACRLLLLQPISLLQMARKTIKKSCRTQVPKATTHSKHPRFPDSPSNLLSTLNLFSHRSKLIPTAVRHQILSILRLLPLPTRRINRAHPVPTANLASRALPHRFKPIGRRRRAQWGQGTHRIPILVVEV